MLGVINYSACRGMAGREFHSKANLTHDLYSSPNLKNKKQTKTMLGVGEGSGAGRDKKLTVVLTS